MKHKLILGKFTLLNYLFVKIRNEFNLSFLVIIMNQAFVLGQIGSGCNCYYSPTATIGVTNDTKDITLYVSSPITSGCYIVKGIVEISSDFIISGGEFQMEEGSELRIKSGATLSVSSVTSNGGFHGCDKMWRGFNVLSGGILSLKNSKVMDAQYAIKASGTANIMANTNTFHHNYVGLYIPPAVGNGINNVRLNVYANTFDSPDLGSGAGYLRLPGYNGMSPNPNGRSYAGFFINNANVIIGSQFTSFFGPNTIQHMRVGVHARYSIIHCNYMDISNMIPMNGNTQYTAPEGTGILVFKSTLRASNNTIDHAIVGIAGVYSKLVQIDHNDISYVDVGIIDQRAEHAPTITYNDISYFRNRGIWATNQASLTYPMIGHNTISTNGTSATSGYQTVGIILDMIGEFLYGAVIEYNEISLHPNAIGIHVSSGFNIGTGFNEITFDDYTAESLKLGIGIAHSDSRNCFIIDNTVTAGQELDNITAFSSDVVPNTKLCCNTAVNANYGFAFLGDCRKSQGISHNITDGKTCGLWVGESTVLGLQIDRGNIWNSDSYNLAGACNNSTFDLVRQSLFYVENCTSDLWPPTICNQTGCDGPWFWVSDGSSEECNEDSQCDPLFLSPDRDVQFSPIDTGDETASRGLLNSGTYGFALDYESRRHLYERMCIDTSAHNKNSYVDSFYTATQSNNIAKFTNISFEIDTLMTYQSEEQDTLESIFNRIPFIEDSIKTLDSLFSIATTATDSSNVIALRDTAFGRIDSILLRYLEVSAAYRSRVLTEKDSIIYWNNLITAANKIDSNEQIVNDMFLAQWLEDDFEFDSSQKAQLLSVAQQCPREGGGIVYKARSLYRMVADSLWDDSACKDSFLLVRSVVKERVKMDKINIIPNPSSHSLYMNITDLINDDPLVVELYDISGKLKDTRTISPPTKGQTDLSDMINRSGIFTMIVRRGKEIVYRQKQIIISRP